MAFCHVLLHPRIISMLFTLGPQSSGIGLLAHCRLQIAVIRGTVYRRAINLLVVKIFEHVHI